LPPTWLIKLKSGAFSSSSESSESLAYFISLARARRAYILRSRSSASSTFLTGAVVTALGVA
jgi:hypothetical protein